MSMCALREQLSVEGRDARDKDHYSAEAVSDLNVNLPYNDTKGTAKQKQTLNPNTEDDVCSCIFMHIHAYLCN